MSGQDTVLASLRNQARQALDDELNSYSRFVFARDVMQSGCGHGALGISEAEYERLRVLANPTTTERDPASFVTRNRIGLSGAEIAAMTGTGGLLIR